MTTTIISRLKASMIVVSKDKDKTRVEDKVKTKSRNQESKIRCLLLLVAVATRWAKSLSTICKVVIVVLGTSDSNIKIFEVEDGDAS